MAELESRVAVLETQMQANKEIFVTATEDIKEEVRGLHTSFGGVTNDVQAMRAQMQAEAASRKALSKAKGTLWAAIVAIAGLVGFIINVYMHKEGG